MHRSTERILTTHVGSLPRPLDLIAMVQARDSGEKYDPEAVERRVRESVGEVVAKQIEIGIDVINDGEHSKASFSTYVGHRMSGFELTDEPHGFVGTSRDVSEFKDVYEEMRAMCNARPSRIAVPRRHQGYACTGPLRYTGQAEIATDIANLRAAIGSKPPGECFMTSLSPNNVALYYRNRFYKNEEEYSVAIADAMREEYRAIIDAGFLLQIDDPRLATHYDRHPEESVEDCRRFIETQVEILNYALRGIPQDRVRFHTCYSTNVAPRVHDLELRHYVDLLLKINVSGYSFEAANPRHEHEWIVWQDVKLPEDRVLMPGVVSHCVALVEHPELVAQRIERFAGIVGPERVVASNDCGFATAGAGDEVHPKVAWAKMKALVEGARLASGRLYGGAAGRGPSKRQARA